MKKLTLIAGLVLMAMATQAQPGHRSRGAQKGKMEQNGKAREMAQELNLTDAQKAKMKEENERFRNAMRAVKDDPGLTAEMQHARRKSLNEEHRKNMQNILTPEQRLEAEKMRKERAAEMRKNGSDQMTDGNWDEKRKKAHDAEMEKLNLSQEQKAKLETARMDMQREMNELKNNSSLSQEERRSQMKQIHERHVNTLRTTLTPQQYTQWQQLQKQHQQRREMPRHQPAKTKK